MTGVQTCALPICNRDEWKEHTKAQSKEARRLWLDRFKEPMPEHVNAYPAETLSARSKWYEGSRKLTPQEIEFLDNLEGFDFTMDMLWLVVEKCGWYIGQPVSLKDPKWELVRPWDDECVSYGECVLGGLNMGSVGYEGTGKDMKWLIGKYLPQKNR